MTANNAKAQHSAYGLYMDHKYVNVSLDRYTGDALVDRMVENNLETMSPGGLRWLELASTYLLEADSVWYNAGEHHLFLCAEQDGDEDRYFLHFQFT